MTTLLVSLKNNVQDPAAHQAFRQIEYWANQQNLNLFTLASPFVAVTPGYAKPGWIIDALGLIHLQGEIQYVGTLSSGSFSSTIAPIPPAVTPVNIHNFSVNLTDAGFTITPGIVQCTPTEVRIATATTLTNPTFSLDGITYYPNY